jgi:putative ABC transport system substrate-binding protein
MNTPGKKRLLAPGFVHLLATITLSTYSLVGAQQVTKVIPRVGFISSAGLPTSPSPLLDAFRLGLRDLGYVEGTNISIVDRYAEGRLDRMPVLVDELVQQKVSVIFAVNNVVIRAAKEATKTIPIVMISSVDPAVAGYVQSFARPGGNITGLTTVARDLSAKRVELLKQVLPKISRLGVLWDANGPGPAIAVKEYDAAARGFKLQLRSFKVKGPDPDFASAFEASKAARIEALLVVGNPLMAQHTKEVFELATKSRLPSMTEEGRYVDGGGLISYGANLADLYRRGAVYVVEILKGAKPADLPVKLAERFEIFINLKTAQQLGVSIPQHVLIQADKVIK